MTLKGNRMQNNQTKKEEKDWLNVTRWAQRPSTTCPAQGANRLKENKLPTTLIKSGSIFLNVEDDPLLFVIYEKLNEASLCFGRRHFAALGNKSIMNII